MQPSLVDATMRPVFRCTAGNTAKRTPLNPIFAPILRPEEEREREKERDDGLLLAESSDNDTLEPDAVMNVKLSPPRFRAGARSTGGNVTLIISDMCALTQKRRAPPRKAPSRAYRWRKKIILRRRLHIFSRAPRTMEDDRAVSRSFPATRTRDEKKEALSPRTAGSHRPTMSHVSPP
ncbi:hypothetical protein PUN28_005318 [Cardiocondyla obscurior]|uniref:Uncharacterized protein n=1 Tax=Cardiocondyla obscurior TaxID=286306 RepID=A0AAW2GF92_9HYME